MVTLRPHQERCISALRAAYQSGKQRVVVVMPTGAGKTVTGGEVVRRVVERGSRVLWLAHRGELVDQAAATLARLGLVVGAISASAMTPPNPYAGVQVATVQTLLARKQRPDAAFVVVDEAHHFVADEMHALLRNYGDARVLGLTATPERGDGRGLGEFFDGIVPGVSVRELTAAGHLVPCEVLRPNQPLQPGQIAQHPADAWATLARDRRTIIFARSVELAEEYTAAIRERGGTAACVTGETPWAERTMTLEAFRRGGIQVLVNVAVLTEGFDAPETSCVILARGCGSAGLYLQMVGRALRPAAGKRDALLIDLRGVSHEHGRPEDDRLYSLDGRGIRRKDDVVYCPVCATQREPGEPCASCGWQPAGDPLKPDTVTGDPLVKFAAKRAEPDDKRAATLARWMRDASARGYKPGWVYAKYRAVYGAQPTHDVVSGARALLRTGTDE